MKIDLSLKKFFIFLNLNDIDGLINKEKIQNLNEKNDKNFNFSEKLKKNIILAKINFYLRSKSALYVYMKSLVIDPSKIHF